VLLSCDTYSGKSGNEKNCGCIVKLRFKISEFPCSVCVDHCLRCVHQLLQQFPCNTVFRRMKRYYNRFILFSLRVNLNTKLYSLSCSLLIFVWDLNFKCGVNLDASLLGSCPMLSAGCLYIYLFI
jgi:hypothetical protein